MKKTGMGGCVLVPKRRVEDFCLSKKKKVVIMNYDDLSRRWILVTIIAQVYEHETGRAKC